MFIINEDKSIYITRGDFAAFTIRVDEDDSGAAHIFRPGDVVRFKVFEKKGCDTVVLQKDFPIIEECDAVEIRLLGAETKIGDIIHKPKDFWYEVELNPDTYPQTVIGYDEDGAKTFRLLPEGKDLEPDEDEEQQGTSVYERVLALVGTMSEHGRQAAEDSQAATAAAAAAEQSAADAAEVARSVRADADSGMFTPQVGENGNWWIGGEDTGILASNANVGNIIETTRTDLGDRWVLCNGDVVPEGMYPGLHEVMPYNTQWRPMVQSVSPLGNSASSDGYMYIRPLPVPGQWAFLGQFSYYNVNAGQKAGVYDANTETFIEFDCPTIAAAKNNCAIFGLTHDGDRYILGVYEQHSDRQCDDVVYLLASDNLEEWAVVYSGQFGSWMNDIYSICCYVGCDLSFDGENILVYTQYENLTSSTTTYSMKIYAVDKALTQKTLLYEATGADTYRRFVLLPNGYWTQKSSADESVSVYPAGAKTALFGFSSGYHHGRIAFFSDRYWLGLPVAETTSTHIQAADLTTNEVKSLNVSTVTGGNANVLIDAEYDPNANEWTLYTRYGATSRYYALTISADADPTVAGNYKCAQIKTLPDTLSKEQMKPDRSQLNNVSNANRVLRDPNIKVLPTYGGETYKYIYAGGADE